MKKNIYTALFGGLILVMILSCSKKKDCYSCYYTWIRDLEVGKRGDSTHVGSRTEIYCDKTEKQINKFMSDKLANKSGDTTFVEYNCTVQ